MQIDFIDETNSLTNKEKKDVEQLLQLAAEMEKVKERAELSITFVDNESIRSLNKEYRGIDRETDVLSFALNDGEEEVDHDFEEMPKLLGDIVVSVEKAATQAEEYGHSYQRELGFLVVHGFLHLLGYHHEEKEAEKIMFARQEQILSAYGLER